jgi:hypothetical protein
MVDIPAEEFSERSKVTGKLVWDEVPYGTVICGLRESDQSRTLKVITRASDGAELEKFGHPRMPCIGKPKFPTADIPEETEPQGWLF